MVAHGHKRKKKKESHGFTEDEYLAYNGFCNYVVVDALCAKTIPHTFFYYGFLFVP